MKSRRAMNIVAIVFALIAGVVVFAYTSAADRRALQGQEPRDVVVSTGVVPLGTTLGQALTDGLVELTRVPAKSLPVGAVTSVTAANRDLYALAAVPAGQVLLEANFGPELPQVGGLRVQAGELALTVELNDPARVADFLNPGSEIAIFATSEVLNLGTGATISTTRIIVSPATVLAIGSTTNTSEEPADQTPEAAERKALVTVSVTQAEAERIVHAVQTGKLYLGLLGEGTVVVSPPVITNQSLYGK